MNELSPRPRATSLRNPADLVEAGLAAPDRRAALETVAQRYAVALTPEMAELIDPADPNDPIALQFLPDPRELESRPEELADPIGDGAHSPVKGIVHRYPDRVLLKPVHVCPVYCRFCFRREMVGPVGLGALSPAELDAALGYVSSRPALFEVIVTGGDPFMLAPKRVAEIAARIGAIGHVRVMRWHSRVPLVDPGRVSPELIGALKRFGRAVYVAVHANHPREFTPAGRAALAALADAGIPLVSQSVLLKGVNDDAATLEALMRAFLENRVKPYYLHHADLAPGTAHLRTSVARGRELMRALRGRVSGLAQPTYVLDIPGGHGKAPLGPDYGGIGSVTDFRGQEHPYDGGEPDAQI
jgi:lysine 2,3-aminomutase